MVIAKSRYSGFFNTGIDSALRARGIRTLVFTGIATNVCVESSLRDAFHLEYFGVVLADATHQAGPDYIQQAALYNIETFFGWVSSVADFCGTIGQVSPSRSEEHTSELQSLMRTSYAVFCLKKKKNIKTKKLHNNRVRQQSTQTHINTTVIRRY